MICMRKKILITATELHMYQFWTKHIKNLIDNGFDVDLVCSHVGGRLDDLKKRLTECGDPHLTVVDLKRSPVSPHNLKGYSQLKKYFRDNQYDVVITNEPVMGIMTRLAARTARRKNGTKVIYFAHGFHFWTGAPRLNWLLFYPVEKFGAHFTDVLVTMNTEDYERAKKHIHAKKVLYTYGIGVDLSEFYPRGGVRERKRKELNICDNTFVLFSASELSDRKNLTLAIDVVKLLIDKGYDIHFFNRGTGDKQQELEAYIKEKGVEDKVTLMGYGKDVDEMCLAADAFIFTSKQEGLPVAVMEAMSSRLPCVVSKIRGVTDLVKDGEGGFACPLDNANSFCDKIIYLIDNNSFEFRARLTENNQRLLEPYSFESVSEFILNLVDEV